MHAGEGSRQGGDGGRGICLLDGEGLVLFRDEAFERALGVEVPPGAPLREVTPALPVDLARPARISLPVGGGHLELELTPASSAGPVAAVVVVRDLAAQRDAEEALRVARRTLTSLIEASPVGIVTLDLDKNTTLWNPAAEAMFGWSREEVLGRPYPLVPEHEQEVFEDLFERVVRGEGFTGVEGRRARKDGRLVDLRIHTAPLRDAVGGVTGAMAILEDLTEQHRLAERVRHGQKMEAVGRLAGGVAHDFNNLLTIILATCELLGVRHALGPEVAEGLSTIRECGERARKLTAQLLAFSRRQVLRPEVADANQLVLDTARLLRRVIGEEIRMLFDLAEDPVPICVDTNQFDQMLVNLGVNARDAMPDGGEVILRTRVVERRASGTVSGLPPGRYAEVAVEDTGCGIDPAVLPHIFDPFFTTKGDGEGTGLGLATVHGIAEQSGGAVEVESEVGRGTTFRVHLPLASAAELRPRRGAVDPELPRGSERVLLVEDDVGVREVTERMLASLGYRVTTACDGVDALALVDGGGHFEVVVTDLSMPKMNGHRLVEALRHRGFGAVVIFMSAHLDAPELREEVEAGSVFFLQKPLSRASLARQVRAALASGAEERATVPDTVGDTGGGR